MSGPATAAFSLAPFGAVALAAMALREARQMGREYLDVLEEIKTRSAALTHAKRESQKARIEASMVLRHRALRVESRLTRLRDVAAKLQTDCGVPFEAELPAEIHTPADKRGDAWQRHIAALESEVSRLQSYIQQHSTSAAAAAFDSQPEEVVTPVEEALHTYMMHRALHAQLNPLQSDVLRQMVARVLSRLDLDPGEPVPVELDHLAQAIVLAPDLERAEALTMELRLRVQAQQKDRAAQRSDVALALSWLDIMADDVPLELQQLLEEIAAGVRLLDAHSREQVRATLQTIEAQRKQLQEKAAAQVLEQSLRDLGYEVDGVENTFFIEGGVAHFQRHGWGEYFVRMRVGVADKTLNFNVVRAKGAQESAERQRVDTMAEDRWCTEFPQLLKTLAARGIELNVTRLLDAGQLPVQVVDASTLPAAMDEEQKRVRAKLHEMKP